MKNLICLALGTLALITAETSFARSPIRPIGPIDVVHPIAPVDPKPVAPSQLMLHQLPQGATIQMKRGLHFSADQKGVLTIRKGQYACQVTPSDKIQDMLDKGTDVFLRPKTLKVEEANLSQNGPVRMSEVTLDNEFLSGLKCYRAAGKMMPTPISLKAFEENFGDYFDVKLFGDRKAVTPIFDREIRPTLDSGLTDDESYEQMQNSDADSAI